MFLSMKKLLSTTLALTYILIIWGGTVRAYGAGLACPDWPLCLGKVIPPLDFLVFLEWGHRMLASIIGFFMLAIMCFALISAEYRQKLGLISVFAFILLLAQAVMGAITVFELNSPASVSVHLGLALIFASTLLIMRLKLCASVAVKYAGTLYRALIATIILVYGQLLLGAWVAASHAGLACPDWPLCFGSWLPQDMGPLVNLQVAHRFVAYAILVAVASCCWISRKAQLGKYLRLVLFLTGVITFAQVLIGIGNIFLAMPQFLRIAHLGGASLLFLMLVVTTYEIHRARISKSY